MMAMWSKRFEDIVAAMVHGFWSVLHILAVTFTMAILVLSTKGKIFIINLSCYLRAIYMNVLNFLEIMIELFSFIPSATKSTLLIIYLL